LRVRTAVPDDIPGIVQIERDSPSAAHWPEAYYRKMFEDGTVPGRVLLSAEDETGLQGFLVAAHFGNEWELENVVVCPRARRSGVGTMLLVELLKLASGEHGRQMFLEVRESNMAARKLYEKFAFCVTGRRPGYYSSPAEDAILYRLQFANPK